MSLQVAVVGPTGAGKTVYAACLLRAAFSRATRRAIKVRPNPDDPAARALDGAALDVLRGGVPPATTHVAAIELLVDLPGSIFFDLGHETLSLRLLDMPGGDCMPPAGQGFPRQVLSALARASALLLVIPADYQRRPRDLVSRLAHLANQVASARSAGSGPLFTRVAVALTMSELLALGQTPGTVSVLERLEPSSWVSQVCGQAFIDQVRALVPPGGDWYSTVSAFGFDAATGRPTAPRPRSSTSAPSDFDDDWQPYRVFEPIEFLARGVCFREQLR